MRGYVVLTTAQAHAVVLWAARSAQRSESPGQTIQDLVRRLALQAALVAGLLIWMVVLRIVGGGSCASSTQTHAQTEVGRVILTVAPRRLRPPTIGAGGLVMSLSSTAFAH